MKFGDKNSQHDKDNLLIIFVNPCQRRCTHFVKFANICNFFHHTATNSHGILAFARPVPLLHCDRDPTLQSNFSQITTTAGCDEYKCLIQIFEYIYIQANIQYMSKYPNIFVWSKIIWMNIPIHLYQTNYTNMIQTNICIGKYLNIRTCSYKIFYVRVYIWC